MTTQVSTNMAGTPGFPDRDARRWRARRLLALAALVVLLVLVARGDAPDDSRFNPFSRLEIDIPAGDTAKIDTRLLPDGSINFDLVDPKTGEIRSSGSFIVDNESGNEPE